MSIRQSLLVSEQFYSLQGEGMTTGRPANFLRLAKCNLMCGGAGTERDGKLHHGATWRCDTIEVWSTGLLKTFEQVRDAFKPCDRLIITGGEPLLHQKEIVEFLDWWAPQIEQLPIVEIETNGTIEPDTNLRDYVAQWNVSPKLFNSGVKERIRQLHPVFYMLQESGWCDIQFKFVVTNINDMAEVAAFGLPKDKIWLMPGADASDPLKDLAPQVAEWAKDNGYNFSNRLHIALWNRKTGV